MDINILSVIVSGVGSMVLGFVWYGPLFAKPWMKEVGLKEADLKSGPGTGYLFTFIGAMVMAAVTSFLVHRLGITQVQDGAFLGLVVGVGYVGTTFLSNYIFAQKSSKLFFIDSGYQILNVVMAAIVTTLIR